MILPDTTIWLILERSRHKVSVAYRLMVPDEIADIVDKFIQLPSDTTRDALHDQNLINSAHAKNRLHFPSSSRLMDECGKSGFTVFPILSALDIP